MRWDIRFVFCFVKICACRNSVGARWLGHWGRALIGLHWWSSAWWCSEHDCCYWIKGTTRWTFWLVMALDWDSTCHPCVGALFTTNRCWIVPLLLRMALNSSNSIILQSVCFWYISKHPFGFLLACDSLFEYFKGFLAFYVSQWKP